LAIKVGEGEIDNSLSPDAEKADAEGHGLGTRLIAAFASKLEAKIEQGRQGDRYVVRVVFRRSA
jgi:two-component sensor histidine kinase